MNPLNFSGKGFKLLWESVTTRGLPISQAVQSIGDRMLRNSKQAPPSPPLKHRHIQVQASKFSTHSPPNSHKNLNLFSGYTNLSPLQKILSLTYSGLRMLGAPMLTTPTVSDQDVQMAWERLQDSYPALEKYHTDQPWENLSHLTLVIDPFDPRVQSRHIIEDINEALVLSALFENPQDMIQIPFGARSTEDSVAGQGLLLDRLPPGAFIFEDGSSHGQHLSSLVMSLKERDIPVNALGTDIAYSSTNTARMLAISIGAEKTLSFCVGHALHRPSPRIISPNAPQYTTLAYRMIPVFDEQKILRYMKKISAEMRPSDLWCGSIALPEGRLYERYTSDKATIKEYSIHPVPTSFGGVTFVHRPGFPKNASVTALVQHFNLQFANLKLRFKEEDFSNVVLNTYMTKNQFEQLARQHGLRFASDPIVVTCEDNTRLTVLLEKAD